MLINKLIKITFIQWLYKGDFFYFNDLDINFNNSIQVSLVLLFLSKSGLYSTKSIDLTKLVLKIDSNNILLSVNDNPSLTGVPVPGTYSGSKQSIS